MSNFLKAILIGVLQGITEWLPVSSTGHMILLDDLIGLDTSEEFFELFLVAVQLGSVFAVLTLYFSVLNPFSLTKSRIEKKKTLVLWGKIVLAVAPAAIVGMLFENEIYTVFFNPTVVSIALIVYGVIFIILERRRAGRKYASVISPSRAFGIGCFQALSLVPGTSRSGSTIIGALLLGVSREKAAEFSFLMAVPVMLGASFIKLLGFGYSFEKDELILLVLGVLSAYIISLLVIRFLVDFVKCHSFECFGWYRLALGLVVIALKKLQ